jgi:hypothetical protein
MVYCLPWPGFPIWNCLDLLQVRNAHILAGIGRSSLRKKLKPPIKHDRWLRLLEIVVGGVA